MSLLLLVALGSCQAPVSTNAAEAERTSSKPSPEQRENAPRAVQVATLAGDWRVAGIDGRSLDEPVGLALRANNQEIWWEPRCAGMARSYRIKGSQVSFGSTEPRRSAGAPTPPVCAIGLPPKLKEVFEALDGAATVLRTPSNGIEIAGPSHSITLFSQ